MRELPGDCIYFKDIGGLIPFMGHKQPTLCDYMPPKQEMIELKGQVESTLPV